ncbi:MAG: epoxide hydrolase family protein [Actinoplanes sp.]
MVLDVPAADLADLHSRLRATRWTPPWAGGGVPAERLRALTHRWADDYDWPAHQTEINALPWHTAEIAGAPLRYLRFDGGARPLVLTHGWPSTVLELTALATRLADAGFTAIVPALPGFPFSPQRPEYPSNPQTHELWHHLMREELGFQRYGAHGGDLGAGTSARLGEAYPDAVAGVHVLAVGGPADPDPATLTDEERDYLAQEDAWYATEGAYEHQQRTRPLTVAAALADSPAGLLAWLVEKYDLWTDRPFPDDFVLTQASLYWLTNSIGTSFRPYYEHAVGATRRIEQVTVPTAVAVFPKDLVQPPRRWAERMHHVTRYTVMPRGGHFAAYEEPDLLAVDVAEFFGPLL